MASFEKRGKRWRAHTCVNNIRKSKAFNSKREARAWADEIEEGLETGMLYQAFDRYKEFESPKHKSYRSECLRLERFKREFDNVQLNEVKPSVLAAWRDKRLKEVKEGSVNRDISLLNAVLNLAMREWGWLDDNPLKAVRKPRNPPPRRRGVTQAEIDKILKVNRWCGVVESKRDQVSAAFLIAIETAMRASEILNCETHPDRRVAVILDSKNGDRREVPLSSEALSLFNEVGKFTISAESLSTLFRRIKIEADIPDLHFHDTRSEALTRLSKKLDILQLARVVGHRDPRSLMIYYSASASDMAKLLD